MLSKKAIIGQQKPKGKHLTNNTLIYGIEFKSL